MAARTVPTAITAPPTHSHSTKGWTVTRTTVAEDSSSGTASTANWRSSRNVDLVAGVPMVWPPNGKTLMAGK